MLDGMEGSRMYNRFTVRLLHADIESCNGFAANLIFPGNVNSTKKFLVVDGK
jgi:hypothetical protein